MYAYLIFTHPPFLYYIGVWSVCLDWRKSKFLLRLAIMGSDYVSLCHNSYYYGDNQQRSYIYPRATYCWSDSK